MKTMRNLIGLLLLIALVAGVWIVRFHSEWLNRSSKEEEEETAGTEVPMQTGRITRRTLRRYVDGFGAVDPEPARAGRQPASAAVASLVAGIVGLASAGNDLKVAEKQLAILKASSTREEIFEATAKVTEADRALALAQTQRSLLKIPTPLDATVVRVLVNPGEGVDATKVLVELTALDRLVVHATVPADDLLSLRAELPVEIHVRGKPASIASAPPASQPVRNESRPSDGSTPSDALCHGTTYFIAPQVDRKTNTVLIGIAIPAKAGLRPGQYVRVRIVVEEHRDRLAVPRESVVTAGAYGLPKETTIRLANQ